MELGKLSVYHNIYNQKQPVATTLLGVGRMEILKLNMDIVREGLTETEEQVFHEVIEKFFSDMDNNAAGWDNVEVEEFNKAVGKD